MDLHRNRLKNKKVAVLVADGFEMAEFTVPVNPLRIAGADITVVSLRHGRIRGVNLHEPAHKVRADLTVAEANEADYDALFVPSGFINPDLLQQSARAFVAAFERSRKPIATLCHGPWVLASAGLAEGRTLTSWPGTRDDMVNAGATWLDQPAVRDGNWVTSRGPQDFAEFVPAVIELFAGAGRSEERGDDERGKKASSPQPTEPPGIVLQTLGRMPRPSFRGLALGLAAGGLIAINRRAVARAPSPSRKPPRETQAFAP